jgi:putative ABC transport system permease protein
MDYHELLLESFTTLTLNKVRTGLAMLGVIIGIGSVIALISLGQASQKSIETQIKSLGSNLLTINPSFQISGGVRQAGGVTSLTYDDAKAIAGSPQVTTIQAVAPEYSDRGQVVAGRNNTNTQIAGVTPEYSQVRNLEIASGSFITEAHVTGMAKVAVLGPQTATDLFGPLAGGTDPVGQTVRIKSIAFTVIGVTASKGGSGMGNQDDRVWVPLTTAQKLLFGVNHISSISLQAASEAQMTEAQNQVGYLLLARHKLKDPALADFSIMSQEDILGTASEVTGTFTALLSGIAVTERTREIGLRKALGAKKKIITAQFLSEAVIITFVGGLIGAVLGIVVSLVLASSMSLPFTIAFSSIFLAFGVSAAIGILFGWYPARKAANLQPIDALRYE